jgi:hypothetical protein
MRFFELLNFQHLMLALFPTLIFIILLALALGHSHFRRPDSDERKRKIIYKYPDGIEDRNAPFPLVMTLIIAGTVVWAFFYILFYGLLKVKI